MSIARSDDTGTERDPDRTLEERARLARASADASHDRAVQAHTRAISVHEQAAQLHEVAGRIAEHAGRTEAALRERTASARQHELASVERERRSLATAHEVNSGPWSDGVPDAAASGETAPADPGTSPPTDRGA